MHSGQPSSACRVCGRIYEEPPWGADGKTAIFEICPCCGVEFGYEDSLPESVRRYRAIWLAGGANWFEPKLRPENWSLETQLAQVAPQFA
ncbi:MAG TPA: hypothetical protein VM847_04340 [Tahibacter sp.]|nr:hypothetical protein [Tahibacter sp.]